ncbi:nucleoside triphosphate pyrophosphohydrolase [Simiduia agarivorans]|uniref:Nucleoside triphosphate pyrophosphohydrolase n=1 Tax=Simiduia agarivorans (strain DSM 21679 / JCM 13881 / BCRC 17597 / SA1) TaxID=1117647 RepID=K4KFL6_SIMAS|nr:nucleoside triphosphate pyrophosphohydrolase [Simiduia agarivorans]AFU97869.1 nucleoside triphosphate pyrophosphohydrolase [Simiduia agarivorans SA1 = DSM 21679]
MTYSLKDLLYLMARLRDPETGCPWDLKQDFASIVPSTLEEAYEVADAIERNDMAHLKEELGDLLFQVVFYAQLGKEADHFDFDAVVDELTRKLIARHPHVFPSGNLQSVRTEEGGFDTDVSGQWESLKAMEREKKGYASVLDDVPMALPAIQRAQKLQKRASTVGFDFSTVESAMDKVREELAEVEVEVAAGDRHALADELGDLLFAVVNVARIAGYDAESLVRRTNKKFAHRFEKMAAKLAQEGLALEDASLEQMEAAWINIKQR